MEGVVGTDGRYLRHSVQAVPRASVLRAQDPLVLDLQRLHNGDIPLRYRGAHPGQDAEGRLR